MTKSPAKRKKPAPAPDTTSVAATWLGDQILVLATSAEATEGLRATKAAAPSGVQCDGRWIAWQHAPGASGEVLLDPKTFARQHLAPLSAEDRERILTLLTQALDSPLTPVARRRLAVALAEWREVLRERLPNCTPSRGEPLGLQIDSLLRVDERSFYVRGWFRDGEADAVRLTAVSPEGARAELLGGTFRFARADVHRFYEANPDDGDAKFGFIRFFTLPAPACLDSGFVFELRSGSGASVEIESPAAVTDIITVRDSILQDLSHERPPRSQLMRDHAHPALTRLQERRHAQAGVEEVIQYGTPPESPTVSVIVPLYGRIDFLEHQLAQFVHDPELAAADLIYVLDSPALADQLAKSAAGLHQLYGLAFRTVILQRNAGYSTANNIGASFARAPLLLLLNSDVLPDRPGWLGKMAAFHRSQPKLGVLAPKLLFEDDTLQHAGLYFAPLADRSGWENMHYFKGLHRSFPAANVARRVPAVTGACLMISRALFQAHGGLRGSYIQGDYEDSDLCLRLSEAGLENWYLPEVELHHLEGQSYAMPLRQLTGRYNRWLHTHLWDAQIRALMAECGGANS
jgi:GT2 family glycosyltransferase